MEKCSDMSDNREQYNTICRWGQIEELQSWILIHGISILKKKKNPLSLFMKAGNIMIRHIFWKKSVLPEYIGYIKRRSHCS